MDATAELAAVPVPGDLAVAPARLPRTTFRSMRSTWNAFSRGATAFVTAHQADPHQLADELGLPDRLMPLWTAPGGPASELFTIARPDMVVQHGQAWIVDVNSGSLASHFPLNDLLLRAHRRAPLAQFFRAAGTPSYVMGHFADIVRRFMASEQDLVVVSYLAEEDEAGPNPGRWHYQAVVNELCRAGVAATVAPIEDVELSPSGASLAGQRVGVLYRFFLPDPSRAEHVTQLNRLSSAVASGAVHLLTGLREEILNTKATIAILSDERFTSGLPASLATALSTAIPWTRVVRERFTLWQENRIDLLDWVERNQARLLLKPSLGALGRSVTIGREISQSAWRTALTATLTDSEPWVVQELLMPDHQEISYLDQSGVVRTERGPVVYGAFVLDGQFSGAIGRHGRHGDSRLMINGLTGAIPAPVYWSDEPWFVADGSP